MDSKRRNWSLEQKYLVVIDLKKGMPPSQVIQKHGLKNRQHLHSIKKASSVIVAQFESGVNSKRKSLKSTAYPEIDQEMKKFVREKIIQGMPVNRDVLKLHALKVASKKGLDKFKASDGFFSRSNRRNNVQMVTSHGTASSVDQEIVKDWKKKLTLITKNYDNEDIYNLDELGLFYDLLPSKSYILKGDVIKGVKTTKKRLTVLLVTNMSGTDKLPPLVIGKSKKPRCFKNKVPPQWRSNSTAWMTEKIMTQFLSKWNEKLMTKGRKIILFYDNVPSHPSSPKFSNIKIVCLPPNTTSVLQPLDQGIIRSFKCHYRRRILRKVLYELEDMSRSMKDIKISVKDAFDGIVKGWGEVTEKTILNCFKESGFGDADAIQEEDAHCDDGALMEIVEENNIEMSTFQEFVSADDGIRTDDTNLDEDTEVSDNGEIEITQNPIEVDDDMDIDDDEFEPDTTYNEAITCCQRLSKYLSLTSEDKFKGSIEMLDNLEKTIFFAKERKKVQKTITDYLIQVSSNE